MKLTHKVAEAADDATRAKLQAQLGMCDHPTDSTDRLRRVEWMCEYDALIAELSKRLTEWSLGRKDDRGVPYLVSTGGGPGMMEAANRGASSVEGGRTIGMGITLPFESGTFCCLCACAGWCVSMRTHV